MTRIFEDSFESGDFSKWSNVTNTSGIGASDVTAAHPQTGIKSAHFTTTAILATAEAHANKAGLAMPEAFARAYLFINQGIQGMITNDRWYFIRFLAATGDLIAMAGIRREGSNPLQWVLWARGQNTHTYGTTVINQAAAPHWICVEVHYSKAAGVYELFIDGVLEISITAPELVANQKDVGTAFLGILKTGAAASPPGPLDPTGLYPIEVFSDDFVLADSYVGPGVPPPALPKLTVKGDTIVGGVPTGVDQNVPVYIDNLLAGNTPLTVELPLGTHTVRVETEVER